MIALFALFAILFFALGFGAKTLYDEVFGYQTIAFANTGTENNQALNDILKNKGVVVSSTTPQFTYVKVPRGK